MRFLTRFLLPLFGSFSILSLVSAFTPGFPYKTQAVRGVNLGGWLVLEPWITPSLFDNTGDGRIIDEYTFGQYRVAGESEEILKNHWDTWIREHDFKAIAEAGLNHVRIPIGYWAYDVSGGEPFIQGQAEYLDKAIGWAHTYNLKVIIDLHGAPQSQNGSVSTASAPKMDFPHWHTNQKNVERTNAVIKLLTARYKDNTLDIPIIAPLNEPAGFFGKEIMAVTRQYWKDSYENIRYPNGRSQPSTNVVEMIHDAFQPLESWNGFMPEPEYQGVILDTHIYQMFSNESNHMTDAQHIQEACRKGATLANSPLLPVVGEWTATANDCAKYLNGRGVGARYDGTYPKSTRVGSCEGLTGKAETFSREYKQFLGQYWEAQAISYERHGGGWIQWTWKAEQADEWTYKAGLEHGWIPRNPTQYRYPHICG